jgi:hypothetical protein
MRTHRLGRNKPLIRLKDNKHEIEFIAHYPNVFRDAHDVFAELGKANK